MLVKEKKIRKKKHTWGSRHIRVLSPIIIVIVIEVVVDLVVAFGHIGVVVVVVVGGGEWQGGGGLGGCY